MMGGDSNKTVLEWLLIGLQNLELGGTIRNADLDFSIFFQSEELGALIEREEKRILKPLNIYLWKKGDAMLGYEFYSEKRRCTIISKIPSWSLAGGEVTPDNLSGSYFLSAIPSNFSKNTEARIYTSMGDCVFSVDEDKNSKKRSK